MSDTSTPLERLRGNAEGSTDRLVTCADLVLLLDVVERGDELRLWEPGRKGWAAVFARFTAALAALESSVPSGEGEQT